ncbi:MAG: hypothetical protein PHS92_04830 [Candidatus Gracilibacteria bacterium]|nr:hypothetical protein [Candidatus Gracilibacteria bacterium]
MKIKDRYKFLSYAIIAMFFLNISLSFADGMDVNSNLPSGSYDHVLKIELVPTIDNTKTFYSFNPNGTPNDALLYTGAILLKSSTPLIFFSFLNTQVESKIKQNDYTIIYPNTINLSGATETSGDRISGVFLVNNDEKTMDISYWELRKDETIYTVPDGTTLNAGQTFPLDNIFSGSGYISLFSPNLEKKDFIEIVETDTIPEIKNDIKPSVKKIYKRKTQTVADTAKEEIKPTESEVKAEQITSDKEDSNTGSENAIVSDTEDGNSGSMEKIISPASTDLADPNEGGNTMNDNLKLSVNETKVNSNTVLILMMIGGLFLFGLAHQIIQRRKNIIPIKSHIHKNKKTS